MHFVAHRRVVHLHDARVIDGYAETIENVYAVAQTHDRLSHVGTDGLDILHIATCVDAVVVRRGRRRRTDPDGTVAAAYYRCTAWETMEMVLRVFHERRTDMHQDPFAEFPVA